MKRISFVSAFFIVMASLALAQTTVTGTVTDPDSLNWFGGSATFHLYNNAGGIPSVNGVPLTPAQLNPSFVMNSGGTFSGVVSSNAQISPVGTQWDLTLCPAASAPCQQMQRLTITGSTMNITSTITGQLLALRFPAGYTARAYGPVEISPAPQTGATYFDLTLKFPLYWTGTAWVGFGSNTGITPHTPPNSIQLANSDSSSFNSDSLFTIDPTTHFFNSGGNQKVASMESTPRRLYDPMDTKYLGGLGAAIAGTSGHTPTEVLTKVIDTAECDLESAPTNTLAGARIALPSVGQLLITGVKLWSNEEFSGDSLISHPLLQHNDGTQFMVTGHAGTDTLTCPNTVTYTPGASGIVVKNVAISGMGGFNTSPADAGIVMNGESWLVEYITGAGNAFGEEAVWDAGFNNSSNHLGYPGAQLAGCVAYVRGFIAPPGGFGCAAVQIDSIDSETDYVYATDTAGNLTGHAAGPCYTQCSAIALNGANVEGSFLFAQVSETDIIARATNFRGTVWRADATNREAIRINNFNNGVVTDIQITGPCLDTSLATAFNAGTPSGCKAVEVLGQGNRISNVVTVNGGFFGTSYTECNLADEVSGTNFTQNHYSGIEYGIQSNLNNTGRNSNLFCGQFTGDASSGKVDFPVMAPVPVGALASIDVSGVTAITLTTSTPLTNMVDGISAQTMMIYGVAGSSVAPGGNITTCSKLPELGSANGLLFTNLGGYNTAGGSTPNNIWHEVCNSPQADYIHLNWSGNPTVTPGGSVVDFYGNETPRQVPTISMGGANQLHGPAAPSGQYCFEEEAIYADGSHTVSALSCTTVDLLNQTPGEIFLVGTPLQVTTNLYLVSNTTTSGIPTGKYPAATAGFFWDGPTTIKAGGDGTTPPPATENTTGLIFASWGIVLNTAANTQPPCVANTRGRLFVVSGGGTTPDKLQVCTQIAGGTYAWQTTSYTGSSVASVFTRIGAVTANTGDYTAAQVTNALDTSNTGTQTMQGGLTLAAGKVVNSPSVAIGGGQAMTKPPEMVAVFGNATLSSLGNLTGTAYTPAVPITITRIEWQLSATATGCTTNPVVAINVSGTVSGFTATIPLTTFFGHVDSTLNVAANSNLQIKVTTASAGCTPTTSTGSMVMHYVMQ